MVAVNIAARQIEAGHDVRLIFEDLGGDMIELPKQISYEHLVKVPHRTISSRIVDSDFARVAEPVIDAADILHVHGIWRRVPFRSMKYASLIKMPFLISPHGMLNEWALKQNPLRKKAAFLFGTWNLIEKAAGFHALSQYERDCIVKHRLSASLTMVPNGVDLSDLEPLPAGGTFRNKHPALKKDGIGLPFVLFLARLHPGKRLDLLIEAFALVSPNLPELRLVIVGPDFGALADVEARVQLHGLNDKVVITGPIWGKEKFEPLVDATCYCLPSEHESFSVAIVEALACSCPVVISEECHFPEVKDAVAGFEIPLDSQQLAKALHEIVIDCRLREQMSNKARQLVEENYQWNIIAQRITEFYDQLTSKKSAEVVRDREVLSA